MVQLEAKIETGRHNLKIQMDKELVVLQKQINLHVADIERYQGFVSRLAIKKGNTVEELRRTKEKARRTMKQLNASRTTTKKPTGVGATTTLANAGRESIAQSNLARSQTVSQPATEAFVEGSPVDILLFGFKKSNEAFATSFNASQSSDSNSGHAHAVRALQWIMKN